MKEYKNSIIVYSKFWIVLLFYLIIPLIIKPIPCPAWVSCLDNYIPFTWWMIIPYYFYYVIIIIPPFMLKKNKTINFLTDKLIMISVVCYLAYFFWPITSTDILMQVEANKLFFMHRAITFEYLNQNAFPSMHVAVSWLIGLVIIHEDSSKKPVLFIAIISIFLATFLTKQHYIVDSIAGLFLGYIGFWSYKKSLYSN